MTFYSCVEKIEIKSGDLFDCEKDAEAFIVDKISEEINELFIRNEFYDLKQRDLFKIIECLCGNVEKAQKLKQILDVYI